MASEKPDPWNWRHTWELLDSAERLNRTFFLRRGATEDGGDPSRPRIPGGSHRVERSRVRSRRYGSRTSR